MTIRRPPFRIEFQPFDSGRLSPRLGVVRLEDTALAEPGTGTAILETGLRERYDLLTLSTTVPVSLEGFEPRGTMITLEARVGTIWGRLKRISAYASANVRTLRDDDWPAVRRLLRWAAPTRFSTDPHLAPDVVRDHKVAMLRVHAARCPEHALLYVSDRGGGADIVGLAVSYVDENAIVMYEIVVDPEHRKGFATGRLLREGSRRASNTAGDDARAVTRVYRDNIESIRLMERIGMRRTGLAEHHYHAWLQKPGRA